MISHRFALRLAAAATVSGVVGCGSSTAAPISPITAISISYGRNGAKTAALNVGDSLQLTAVAISTGGAEIDPPAPVSYVSRDSRVATVSTDGEIRVVGKGVTRIVGTLTVGSNHYLDSVTAAGGSGALLDR